MKALSSKSLLRGVIVLVCFAATAAHAQHRFGRMETSLYVGGAVGGSKFRTSCDDVPVSCDDKDTGWKVFAGYQFTPNLAVEGGYTDLGRTKASGVVAGVATSADARAEGWELVGVASYPIYDRLSIYGKLGAFWSTVDVGVVATVPGFSASVSLRERSTNLTFGGGVKYSFTPNVGARLEWQRYQNVDGGGNNGSEDIDLFTVGLLYSF